MGKLKSQWPLWALTRKGDFLTYSNNFTIIKTKNNMHLNYSHVDAYGPTFSPVTALSHQSTAKYNTVMVVFHVSVHHQSRHRELHNCHISVNIYLYILFPVGQIIRRSSSKFLLNVNIHIYQVLRHCRFCSLPSL